MSDLKRINCQQASELCAKESSQIIDVRDAGSYQSSRIKDALHIDNASLGAFIDNADPEAALVIYCYHGNSSQQAGYYFIEQGFTDVYSVDGGFEQWKLEHPQDLV